MLFTWYYIKHVSPALQMGHDMQEGWQAKWPLGLLATNAFIPGFRHGAKKATPRKPLRK
jgi:hypothetical protein